MHDWPEHVRRRIAGMSLDPAREAAAVEEIAQHMDDRYEELRASGIAEEEARRSVLSELEGDALTSGLRAALPPARPPSGLAAAGAGSEGVASGLAADLRHGLRLLRFDPGFAAVAILSLALGIGANTAIFQLLDAVRIRTLPVKSPEELLEIRIADPVGGRTGQFSGRRPSLTNPVWEQIRDRQQVFADVFAWSGVGFDLTTSGEARTAQGLWVSGDFFNGLGVPALIGRTLTTDDDRRGCAAPAAVLGYGFWQREYGGDPSVVGRSITLDGHPFPIVGVAPASFFGVEVGRAFDVAVPLCAEPISRGTRTALDKRAVWFLGAMGRLKPGVSMDQARAQLASISAPILKETLPDYRAEDAKHYLEFKLGAYPAGT